MSESAVFELKLQIQHLEEKLTFLAGGTNGAELVAVLMEKDAELEQKVSRQLKADCFSEATRQALLLYVGGVPNPKNRCTWVTLTPLTPVSADSTWCGHVERAPSTRALMSLHV